ncbi:hypothetical protein V1290_000368 [Bradyrhizobium sp. AZCC 1578]
MASLTSFLPKLVPHFEITPAAIYERQRALVRLGLLPRPHGRGRGAGALATPETAALICISLLATDNLSEMDDRITALAHAPIHTHYKRKYCRLTGATDFKNALSAIMGDVNLAQRVRSVDVRRKELEATVHWVKTGRAEFHYQGKNTDLSSFQHRKDFVQHSFTVEASLHGKAIGEIAAALSRSGP